MVVQSASDEEIDRIFRALADTTRRDIVSRVVRGEQSVSGLARRYDMSFAAVQKHVAVLERAALVTKQRRGREQIVYPKVENARLARNLLADYIELWKQRATRMDELLAGETDKD